MKRVNHLVASAFSVLFLLSFSTSVFAWEPWDIVDGVKDFADEIGDTIQDAAKSVEETVEDIVDQVGETTKKVVKIVLPSKTEDYLEIFIPGASLITSDNLSDALLSAGTGLDYDEVEEVVNEVSEALVEISLTGMHFLGFNMITDEILYGAYKEWMKSEVHKGANVWNLSVNHPVVKEYNNKHASRLGVNFVDVRFYHNPNLDNDTAVADCDDVYFPRKNLTVNNDMDWFLHEMTHVKQCQDLGGRKKYGVYWFKNLFAVLGLDTLKLTSFKAIHDAMPMEKEADECADRLLGSTTHSCKRGHTHRKQVQFRTVFNGSSIMN